MTNARAQLPDLPVWPKEPYKGLAYYTAEDRRLFAGRDQDISVCMQRLTNQSIAILLLYGRTGCGKSSFLRAGLIPNMEENEFSCTFLSAFDRKSGHHVPIFVRSSNDPLRSISEALWRYLQDVRIAGKEHTIDAAGAKLGATSRIDFVRKCQNPRVLLDSLISLSKLLPTNLVIILDQAEEVITLSGSDGAEKRNFFDFLKYFIAADINIKFLIALRSEHLGEFRDYSRIDQIGTLKVSQYHLRDLTKEQVKKAVLRPSRRNTSDPPPYDFDFDDDVVDTLLQDLFQARRTGGVLPVMQIVCRDMYNELRHQGSRRVIDARLLDVGKGVAGRLDRHISNSLRTAMIGSGYPTRALPRQEENWRTALVRLADFEQDGTARTSIVPAATVLRYLDEAKVPKKGREDILFELIRPGVLILRQFSFLSPVSGNNETMYALGHDAIGLGLSDWANRAEDARSARFAKRSKRIATGAAVVAVLAAAWTYSSSSLKKTQSEIDALALASARTTDVNPLVSTVAILEAEKIRRTIWAPVRMLNSFPSLDQQLRSLSKQLPSLTAIDPRDGYLLLLNEELFVSQAQLETTGSNWVLRSLKQKYSLAEVPRTNEFRALYSQDLSEHRDTKWSIRTVSSPRSSDLRRPYRSQILVEFDAGGGVKRIELAPERLSLGDFILQNSDLILHNGLTFFYLSKIFGGKNASLIDDPSVSTKVTVTSILKPGLTNINSVTPKEILVWFDRFTSQSNEQFRMDRNRELASTVSNESFTSISGKSVGPFAGQILQVSRTDRLVEIYDVQDLIGRMASPLSAERANDRESPLTLQDFKDNDYLTIYEIEEKDGRLYPGSLILPKWTIADDLQLQPWLNECEQSLFECRVRTPIGSAPDDILLFERVLVAPETTRATELPEVETFLYNISTQEVFDLLIPSTIGRYACGDIGTSGDPEPQFSFSAQAHTFGVKLAVHCEGLASTKIIDVSKSDKISTIEPVSRWTNNEVSDSFFSQDGQILTLISRVGEISSWELNERTEEISTVNRIDEICRRMSVIALATNQDQFEELWKRSIDTPPPNLKEICK
ncbi:hypothetical protein [Roseibium sp.]|uniref:nSTAND1 domain-containing NTPase n=1 Tax=Roseibium sp. TaxID=1936156 RepID=UPI003B511811